MFTKWTKKESLKAVICFVVFFAGVLATQLPGYLSPLYWAIFPGLWFIVYRCMGELGMPVMWVICFTFIIVIALSIVMASVSERLAERIIARRKNRSGIYVKQ